MNADCTRTRHMACNDISPRGAAAGSADSRAVGRFCVISSASRKFVRVAVASNGRERNPARGLALAQTFASPARPAGRETNMRSLDLACFVRRVAITGAIAGVASAAFIAAASVRATGSPASGLNGASQVLWGRAATRVRRVDVHHTLVGLIVHHASAFWWAGIHENPRLRAFAPAAGLRAMLVMAAAAVLDYGVLPRRLSPGLEGQLSRRTIAAAFAVIGAGLALGSWIQDRPLRLRASQVRRLLGNGNARPSEPAQATYVPGTIHTARAPLESVPGHH